MNKRISSAREFGDFIWRRGGAYQAWIDAKDQVFLALLALRRDCVGKDGDTAASTIISE